MPALLFVGFALIPRAPTVEIVNEAFPNDGFVILDDGSFPYSEEAFDGALSFRSPSSAPLEFWIAPAAEDRGKVRLRSEWKRPMSWGSVTSWAEETMYFRIHGTRHESSGVAPGGARQILGYGRVAAPTHLHLGRGLSCDDARVLELALDGAMAEAASLCRELSGASL